MGKQTRCRWWTIILYPDNEVHVKLLEYLRSSANPYQGCCILHEPDYSESTGEGCKKQHYHVVMYYPNGRTKQGIIKAVGKCNVVTLPDGSKKAVLDTTGYDDVTVADICGDSLVSDIKDIHSYAYYLLHKTFAAMNEGKKQYEISDIEVFHYDSEFLHRLFETDKLMEKGAEVYQVIQFINDFKVHTFRDLLVNLYLNNEKELVKYVESHAYLIKQLL